MDSPSVPLHDYLRARRVEVEEALARLLPPVDGRLADHS